jgi:putative glutathione S-transferase
VGDRLTLADVWLWVALVQLDTVHRRHLDAAAVHRVAGHPRLWAYARRLTAHPAFGRHLDLDGIARRHDALCRGAEAAGAAVPIVDWAACVREGAPEAGERTDRPADGADSPARETVGCGCGTAPADAPARTRDLPVN